MLVTFLDSIKKGHALGMIFCFVYFGISGQSVFRPVNDNTLADNTPFPFWEKETKPTRIYFVDQNHERASNENIGSEELPFKTINKAAQVLLPGEKVIIKSGVYREQIIPPRGGKDASKMIAYEAAKGSKVIIKGSELADPERWFQNHQWKYSGDFTTQYTQEDQPQTEPVWVYDLSEFEFSGYNPFGMINMLHDRSYLDYQKVKMDDHFKRRGLVFIDGKRMEQVLTSVELMDKTSGAHWVEHHGRTVHVRFPEGKTPKDSEVEFTTKEQVFAPKIYGLGYIKLKGLTFSQVGNGFPIPQRGAVSANRGNHWVVENCTIESVNSLGMDLGNEMWHTRNEPGNGFHVVRNNTFRDCGISGMEALGANTLLIEDNLFENIAWHNAEHGWESGGIKLHQAQNTLIRRNVFRNIHHATGIWLDYKANDNCRLVKNVFTNITTARGAIYIEVSYNDCLVDHNIFHNLHSQYWISGDYGAGGSAFYTDGSDSIRFQNNLILDIENTGYGSYMNASRIVDDKGGVTRWHSVERNIFIDCKKHVIEYPSQYNFSNDNLMTGVSPGYLKMTNPAPELLLNLEMWRKLFGFGKTSDVTRSPKYILDEKALTLTIEGDPEFVKMCKGRGALIDYTIQNRSIDPRKVYED